MIKYARDGAAAAEGETPKSAVPQSPAPGRQRREVGGDDREDRRWASLLKAASEQDSARGVVVGPKMLL